MKRLILTLFSLCIFSIFHTTDAQNLLEQTQLKIRNHQSFTYSQVAYYPNPMDEIDTLKTSLKFSKSTNSLIGYDYLAISENAEDVYSNGHLQRVNHRKKEVEIFSQNDSREEARYVTSNRNIQYSPLTLLQHTNWKFANDTLINNTNFVDYLRVENDTIVEGNTIYTEQHIFVNRSSKTVERFERRNYYKGSLAQTVVYKYSNYNFNDSIRPTTYQTPANYVSILSGLKSDIVLLKSAEAAPAFILTDLQNNSVDLRKLLGKKVLIDFSVINCGYCKQAIDFFNSSEFKMSDEITAIYVNPSDDYGKVVDYTKKYSIPFPVISETENIGKLYGVSGYPTFFLIDERGIIEKVITGFDKEFLTGLSK